MNLYAPVLVVVVVRLPPIKRAAREGDGTPGENGVALVGDRAGDGAGLGLRERAHGKGEHKRNRKRENLTRREQS